MRFETRVFSGPQSFNPIHDLQLRLVQQRIRDEIPDTLLFLEHAPVVTRGKGLQRRVGEVGPRTKTFETITQPLGNGIQYVEIERGGDLTYHGPGQLVVYPICRLGDRDGLFPDRDIAFFIRTLEAWVLDALDSLSVPGSQKDGASGVWIGEKKIASVGVAFRQWVSFHGLAVNISNDLTPFFSIVPCGYQPETMTRLCDYVKESTVSDFAKRILASINR